MVRPAVLAISTSALVRPGAPPRPRGRPFFRLPISIYVVTTPMWRSRPEERKPQVEPTPKPKNRCPSWEPDIPRQKVTSRRATGIAAFPRSTLSNAIGERRHLRPESESACYSAGTRPTLVTLPATTAHQSKGRKLRSRGVFSCFAGSDPLSRDGLMIRDLRPKRLPARQKSHHGYLNHATACVKPYRSFFFRHRNHTPPRYSWQAKGPHFNGKVPDNRQFRNIRHNLHHFPPQLVR